MNFLRIRDDKYGKLSRLAVASVSLAALAPLTLFWGVYYEYRVSTIEKIDSIITLTVKNHKEFIDRFLQETITAMKLVTQLESLNDIKQTENLQRIFNSLQKDFDHAFEDLGVINSNGDHVSYVGPYDLAGKNYGETQWFRETIEEGVYVSDVFTGFRGVPHCIVAVRRGGANGDWVLRATISAAKFAHVVENVRLGLTGQAFIISKDGTCQTHSRICGKIMQKAPADIVELAHFEGVRFRNVERGGRRVLVAKTWMNSDRWLLVVQQDADDAYGELTSVRNQAVLVFVFGLLSVVAVAVVTARRLVRNIQSADEEKGLLDDQLIQSQKLASIGELAAGIAHEINNPLQVMLMEVGWMKDLMKREELKAVKEVRELTDSIREIGIQAGRCRDITAKLLSFARKMDSVIKDVDINKLLEDTISMREHEAYLENITFARDYEDDLPLVHSDPSLLRQVVLNLINNAIDAISRGGEITVRSRSRGGMVSSSGVKSESGRKFVVISVQDTGCGIPEENMSKLFVPFFTTKPIGKGTGLGLSICHGIVQRLGGTISCESQVGKGTTFTVEIPVVQETRQGGPQR
jgi:two-component system NtrC family sensor kinase